MFPMGFIPNRNHLDTLFGSHDAGLKLRPGLMRKTVAHAQGEFFDFQIFGHHRINNRTRLTAFCP
jgi:hypothetical protein